MLQRNMLQPEGLRGPMSHATQNEQGGGDLGNIMHFVPSFARRQYLVIIFTASFALTMCIIYLRITPPTYTAQVQILLGNPKAQFVEQQSLVPDPVVDMVQIETQLQIIKSRAIAVAVINKLNLTDDPDLGASSHSMGPLSRLRSWLGLSPQVPEVDANTPSETAIAAFQSRLTATRARTTR